MVLLNIFAWLSTPSAPALVQVQAPTPAANHPEPIRKTGRDKKRSTGKRDYLTIVHPMSDEEEKLYISGKHEALISKTQEMRNGCNLLTFPNGSAIMRGEDGSIVWTMNVLREKKEYKVDEETGDLLLKKFGVWSTLEDAVLDELGTLYYHKGDFEIEEHLDGICVQKNKKTGVIVQINGLSNSELVKLPSNEIQKRESCSIERTESFVIWKDGDLSFKSLTHFDTISYEAECASGKQDLNNVYRTEQKWVGGLIVEEKITFKNTSTNRKETSIALQFEGAEKSVLLRSVRSVETKFEEGMAIATTYLLENPEALTVINGNTFHKLMNIAQVRCTMNNGVETISFQSADGVEHFTAKINKALAVV